MGRTAVSEARSRAARALGSRSTSGASPAGAEAGVSAGSWGDSSSLCAGTCLVSRLDRWLARRMLQALADPAIALVLWDGQEIRPDGVSPRARVRVGDRAMLWRLAANPHLEFGEGYSTDRIEIEGDLLDALLAVYGAQTARPVPDGMGGRMAAWLATLLASNTLRGSKRHIHHHYDIGNEFYRLWLDEQMLYTCAYFPSPSASLEEAQRAKMEHICRKLWLRPGETVVEAGCGWGAMALHMARHYGVSVRAFNISREQVAFARRRARDEGLDSRVEFIEDDYRNIAGQCDVFLSVGMLEHVGRDHYHELGRTIDRCLGRVGRGLIHSIGQSQSGKPLNAWIRRRIFPGAYPPALQEMIAFMEPWQLSVLDVENLRLHYARTLEHWLSRFEAAAGLVEQQFDRAFVRMWRLYLAGSQAAFLSGQLQLFQVVFARPAVNEVPWTREAVYRPVLRAESLPSSPPVP